MSDVHQLCRLCLNNEDLVDVFDDQLENAYKLRLYVVLCTGIEIKATDEVSKLICRCCCSLAIELYKFRQAAVANDKSLKSLLNQDCETIALCKESLQNLNESSLTQSAEDQDDQENLPLETDIQDYETILLSKESILNLNESTLKQLAEDDQENLPLETEIQSKKVESSKPILVDVATETDVIEQGNNCETVETLKIRIPKHVLTANVESESSSDNEVGEDNNKLSENQTWIESDEDDTPIATLKRKYRSVRAHKMFKSRFLSESESDSEPISKRSKTNKYYVDDDYSGNETENEDIVEEYDEEDSRQWRKLRPQRRKTQIQQEIETNPEKEVEKQNTEQKHNEPYSKYCEYCDRYFWGNSQLKAHQRVHFRCSYCTKGFESHEVLQEHLVNVCYNSIISQKLCVSLVRADDNIELIRTYQSAFDKYFQDIADGVYGNPELLNNSSAKHHLRRTEALNKIDKYEVHKIFIKFSHLDNSPVHKNLSIQTKRRQTDTSHANLHNVVLDDAHVDMKLYNIPIQFIIDRLQSAYISFAKPVKDTNVSDLWPTTNVIDIVGKFKQRRPSLVNKTLDNNSMQSNISPMLPPLIPTVPVNTGIKKPIYRVMSSGELQQKITQNFPPNGLNNVRPNIIKRPYNKQHSTGSGSNAPNLKIKYIATHASNSPKNVIDNTNNTKNTSNEIDSQKPSNPIILNVLLNDKAKNSYNEPINPNDPNMRILRKTYNRKPSAFEIDTGNISKSVCDNFKIHVLKQNPIETSNQLESNVSHSVNVPPKTIHTKQNLPIQNNVNVNYPPRPNTAIRNMLQNISSEISIEPNYRKQNQTILNTSNNEKTSGTPPISRPNSLSKPPLTAGKPKAYPRPILVKEEPSIEEEEYIIPDQPPSSNDDFSIEKIKEEYETEEHNYSQMRIPEDPTYTTPNLYQNTVEPNLSYPQQHPIRYHNIAQQYYKPMERGTNLPGIRNRFAATQPYRPVQYRARNQMAMYHPRINQPVSNIITPSMPSNALVPTNTYSNNFLPNNVYHRTYGNNFNNYNMYQPPYQNQYSSYNSQTQPAIDFNNPYPPDPSTQDTETKHLTVKQPWEMFR